MTQTRIEEMYAFVAVDPMDDGEGLIAMNMDSGTGPMFVPFVGADMARVDSLKIPAQMLANETGSEILILKFSTREQIGKIVPQEGEASGMLQRDPDNPNLYRS